MSGSSKILMVCGFCICFGVYTSNIQEGSKKINQVGENNSYYAQAVMIATTGLNHAAYNMSIPNWFNSNQVDNKVSVSNTSFNESKFTYIIDKNGCSSSEASVTVTAEFGGASARLRAILNKLPEPIAYSTNWYNNRKDANGNLFTNWEVKRIYIHPYQFTNE